MEPDMYLSKVRRIGGATADQIRAIESWYDWLARPFDKRDMSMESWCGISEDEVDHGLAEKYHDEAKNRCWVWDAARKCPAQRIFRPLGYWQKADGIRGWFVDHVQGGIDDCGEYEVSKEQLEELLDVCGRVLKDPALAHTLLPVRRGFSSGDSVYGEPYFDDLAYTAGVVRRVLKTTDFVNEMVLYQAGR